MRQQHAGDEARKAQQFVPLVLDQLVADLVREHAVGGMLWLAWPGPDHADGD